jgi:GAF domain-containing protein
VQPVFEVIADNAFRLFNAWSVAVFRVDGERIYLAAARGGVPGSEQLLPAAQVPSYIATETHVVGRCIAGKRVIHIRDTETDPDAMPQDREIGRERGFRAIVDVPLLCDGNAIGAISVGRAKPKPFSPAEISLLQTFADQAVIAIENVRLFNETKESLERQTATAEILKVIASSPSDVQPVFDAIAESAKRLLGARSAIVRRVVGDSLELAAHTSTDPAGDQFARNQAPMKLTESGTAAVAARTGAPFFVVDTEDRNADVPEVDRRRAQERGFRSLLVVPMLREGVAVGTIGVARGQPGQFSGHQIALLRTFADQAVIAIENVRLFNETKEGLERQTATAEILKVIASSPSDVQPVFDAIVGSGTKLFPGGFISVTTPEDDKVHLRALAGPSADRVEAWRKSFPVPLRREYINGTAILDSKIVDIPDLRNAPAQFAEGAKHAVSFGYGAATAMPMVRGHAAIGAIGVARSEPGPLTDKELSLLRTFADQAVIAIENVRLFNETKEALERQTATAGILKVMSGSQTDVQPVLQAVAESAAKLCEANDAVIHLRDGDVLRFATQYGGDIGRRRMPVTPISRSWVMGRSVLEGRQIHLRDLAAEVEEYPEGSANAREHGFHSILVTPLMRERHAIGAIIIRRNEVRPFSQTHVDLVRTFADQAAIAIENVRLFNETRESLERLTATSEVLKVISRSPTDVQPVFNAIAERAAVLCEARFSSLSRFDGELIHMAGVHGASPEEEAQVRAAYPMKPGSSTLAARVIRDGKPLHIADVMADPAYDAKEAATSVGFRSVLGVPMTHKGQTVGAIVIARQQEGLFPENQVNLLSTFADQAVIAIENVRLFHEITEKGRQLEIASQHKSQFLASMSHELRTPLNAILGFNEMILDLVYGEISPDVKAPLENMQASGKHLLRLINNVLDLAKIEAGRMELALADYAVQDAVESVRQTLLPLAAEKGLELRAQVPSDIPLVYGDGGRITQCLMNLAGNSLKFTKAGRVEISVEQRVGVLRYCVTDTGIGIPPDKIGSLFTEFKQTDATIASEYGGTGLGLSITKKFIEMHGGRIWVESEPGKGSTFLFEIPLRVAQ